MWQLIRDNHQKSMALAISMACLLIALGYCLGEVIVPGFGWIGACMALWIWILQLILGYYFGDTLFLEMSGAYLITREDHQTLWNVVEEMQIAAGLNVMPQIYIIDDNAPNAFATGRNLDHASIAVTSGLLRRLTRDELQGVVAHEMAHIKNQDVLFMLMIGAMMGSILLLAEIGRHSFRFSGKHSRYWSGNNAKGPWQLQILFLLLALLLFLLAPLVTQFIYCCLSRRREFLADACAVQFTRYPAGLASALEKISKCRFKLMNVNRLTAPMYIVNPMNMTEDGLANESRTHPPISERIEILRSMVSGVSLNHYESAFETVTRKTLHIPSDPSASPLEPVLSCRQPDPAAMVSTLAMARETGNTLWKKNAYTFIRCDCKTTLKIPPHFPDPIIHCPHCQTRHSL